MASTHPRRCLLLGVLALLASMATSIDAGWCPWLSWTCDTKRTPSIVGSTEIIQCAPHRSRLCCNSEPPVKSDTSCPGSSDEWLPDGGASSMRCRSNLVLPMATVPLGRPANACTTAYPRFSPGSLPPDWCPWDYWESWQYPVSGRCRSQRVRSRRCACGGRLSSTRTCTGAPAAGAETQVRDAGCSTWCAWSDWTSAMTSASPLLQRKRTCECGDVWSGDFGASGCHRGEAQLATGAATTLADNGTRGNATATSSRPAAVVVSCLIVLIGGALLLAVIAVSILLWKRALRRRRPCQTFVVSLEVAPTAPAYGGFGGDAPAAATTELETPPAPTSSAAAKAAEAFGQLEDEPPPPYTSQPELRGQRPPQPPPMPPPY